MKSLTKDQIVGALPKLSVEELKAIAAVTASLINDRTGASSEALTPTAQLAFTALSKALNLAIGPANLPPKLRKQFEAKVDELLAWLDTNMKGWRGSKNSELALLTYLFDLLVKDLRKKLIVPTVGTVIGNIHRIPRVLDFAFPGYINSGMAGLILNNFK